MRQMNLQFSIGDLVIVEADSSSTGWAKFLDEVEGWGVRGPGFQDRLQWFYWQVQGKFEDIATYSSHHDDLNVVFDPKYIPLFSACLDGARSSRMEQRELSDQGCSKGARYGEC